ncbi:MAG: hypothetical protein D6706_20165, partial [Chloroflexi bacterium]
AKVELLRPCVVIGLQRDTELAPILTPLRRWPGVTVIDLPVATAVRRRSPAERRQLRAHAYQQYFQHAQRRPLAYHKLASFPHTHFQPGQLIALENKHGLTIALAVVETHFPETGIIWIHTPWDGETAVAAIRQGKLRLDMTTWQDAPLLPPSPNRQWR